MRRRGCIDCHLVEPAPGTWIRGRCPSCNKIAEHRVRERNAACGDAGGTGEAISGTPPPRKIIPTPEWIERPLRHLRALAVRYPRVWQQVDELRAKRGKELPEWPAWCFMPLSGAYAIATQGQDITPSGVDVAVIGALAAWRVSQGIYRFDSTLLDELWNTPVTGDIPAEILERLPEWCCYVPLDPPRRVLGLDTHGFFVHIESDANTNHRELRLLLDVGPSHLTPVPLHLVGNLSECLAESMAEARRNAPEERARLVDLALQYTTAHGHELVPLVSLTLYLCSTSAEILGRDGQHKPLNRPPIRHTKRGARMFPPPRAEVWQVGFRLGATLRAATPGISGPDRGGTHATPRPHLRRAHWHAFWTGPKAKPGLENTDRRLVLHWLPPTLVAATEEDGIIPTVHRVTT